jgi:hypothetical protein
MLILIRLLVYYRCRHHHSILAYYHVSKTELESFYAKLAGGLVPVSPPASYRFWALTSAFVIGVGTKEPRH